MLVVCLNLSPSSLGKLGFGLHQTMCSGKATPARSSAEGVVSIQFWPMRHEKKSAEVEAQLWEKFLAIQRRKEETIRFFRLIEICCDLMPANASATRSHLDGGREES